jgi:hypothetical protein
LVAGQRYAIALDYFENTGLATIKLEWENLAAGLARQIVPQNQLF